MIECVRTGATYGTDERYESVTNSWIFGDSREHRDQASG